MKKLVVLLVLAALVTGAVLAVKHLPWWGLALLFVAVVVFGKWAIKRLLKKLFLAPFKMKGAVLHGATARVHSVTPTVAPPKKEDAEEEENAGPRRYYALDVTIEPKAATGNFSHWEPGELRLARPEHHVNPDDDDSSTDDDACDVMELQYEEDGVFKADEGFKFGGAMRLKMTLAVSEGVSRLKFHYYFEEFGEVVLPASPLAAAA